MNLKVYSILIWDNMIDTIANRFDIYAKGCANGLAEAK